MDSLIFEVAIGMVFVFATFSLLASTLTEAVARFLGLRGEYLLRGVRSLVDGGGKFALPDFKDFGALVGKKPKQPRKIDPDVNVTKVLENPVVTSSANKAVMPGGAGNSRLKRKERRALPSYISARSFSRAVFDMAVPDATGKTTISEVAASIEDMGDGPLKDRLTTLVKSADGSVKQFRLSVEEWYDDHMARVSGWYKRHVRWITLGIAAALVVLFNVNAVHIGRALYGDEALRESVVTQAFEAADCAEQTPAQCIAAVRGEIEQARDTGLPIGWSTVPACAGGASCGPLERFGLTDPDGGVGNDLKLLLVLLLGYALMILAVLPGARFWFDLLSRFGSLRSTGPKPPAAAPSHEP